MTEMSCKFCGAAFTPRSASSHQQYCTIACQRKATRERRKEQTYETDCVVCGETFTTNKAAEAITCSKLCSIVVTSVSQQLYSDDELVQLMFLNPGFGFRRFMKEVSGKTDTDRSLRRLLDIIEIVKETKGVDLYAHLQNPDLMETVPVIDWYEHSGTSYSPKGQGRSTGQGSSRRQMTDRRKAGARNVGRRIKVSLLEFNWGNITPYDELEKN